MASVMVSGESATPANSIHGVDGPWDSICELHSSEHDSPSDDVDERSGLLSGMAEYSSLPTRSLSIDNEQYGSIYEPSLASRKPRNRLLASSRAVIAWLRGPKDATYPSLRRLPESHWQSRVNGFFLKSGRIRWLVLLFWTSFFTTWLSIAGSMIYQSAFASSKELGGGGEAQFLSCQASMWRASSNIVRGSDKKSERGCGIDGRNCEPFDGEELRFRCPARCADAKLLDPRLVGGRAFTGRPYVIGGTIDPVAANPINDVTGYYRADSWICPSAIHAGLVSNAVGGCGTLRTTGRHANFTSTKAHGITSIDFGPSFPKTYRFDRQLNDVGDVKRREECLDLRWPITYINVAFSAIYAFLQPNPQALFTVLFFVGYWHAALVSDPPPLEGIGLLSRGLEGFLPACFVGFATWKVAARELLKMPTYPLDRMLLYLPAFWLGVLSNYVSENIPVSRLLINDIDRDGGWWWVIGGVALVFAIALGQMWTMRRAGVLLPYLGAYVSAGVVLVLLALVPGASLRMHHYIFAILFLPGTGLQTRPAFIYQGLLLGLFLNGTARWGFDSIVETWDALKEGAKYEGLVPQFVLPQDGTWLDWRAQLGGVLAWTTASALSQLTPGVLPIIGTGAGAGTTAGGEPDAAAAASNASFSLFIDDIERYSGTDALYNLTRALELAEAGDEKYAWLRDVPQTEPHFARVRFTPPSWSMDIFASSSISTSATRARQLQQATKLPEGSTLDLGLETYEPDLTPMKNKHVDDVAVFYTNGSIHLAGTPSDG